MEPKTAGDWRKWVEDFAESLSEIADQPGGGSAVNLALRNGIPVYRRKLESPLVYAKCSKAFFEIYLSIDLYGPEIEFSCGHEVFELFELLEGVVYPRAIRESLCDLGARAIALPRASFRRGLREEGLNLPALHQRFPWAPPRVIAQRLVDLEPGYLACGYTWAHQDWRAASNDLIEGPALDWAVLRALGLAYKGGAPSRTLSHQGVLAHSWRTDTLRPNKALVVCRSR